MGRWDYGPLVLAAVHRPDANGPVANPYYDPLNAPWEPPEIPGHAEPVARPEAFMDTPMVNGTAYP